MWWRGAELRKSEGRQTCLDSAVGVQCPAAGSNGASRHLWSVEKICRTGKICKFSSVISGVQGSVDVVSKLYVKWLIGQLFQIFGLKSYFHYSVVVNKRISAARWCQSLSRSVVRTVASALPNPTFKPVAVTVFKLDTAYPRDQMMIIITMMKVVMMMV